MPKRIPDSRQFLSQRVRKDLEERKGKNRLRELRLAGPVRMNLADNDYLGLAQNEALKSAAHAALATGPVSASSSPLVRGYQETHAKLEKILCAWHRFPCGLVWNSGFAANQAVLGALAKPDDIILADRLVHHSLIAGILKSRAKFHRFAHNDLTALDKLLKENTRAGRVVWVVAESVYSMDGDCADLARLADLKRRHGFIWLLDEAHALGWYGPQGQGRATATGVADSVDILIGTLGKALGSMGAYSLFRDPNLREALINQASEFIYSTYLSPVLAAAATAAIGCASEMAPQATEWRAQSQRFRAELSAQGWKVPADDSPIVPVIIGDDAEVESLGHYLAERGFAIGAIRPPTVPEGTARLRISLKATTTWADLESLIVVLNDWRDRFRKKS